MGNDSSKGAKGGGAASGAATSSGGAAGGGGGGGGSGVPAITLRSEGMLFGGERVTTDDFQALKVIGKGSFGKVKLVRHIASGRIFAMKVLKKDVVIKRDQLEHTITERRILQKAAHPFLIQMHFAFQTPDKLYLVLDFAPGGELFFHLKRRGIFDEYHVAYYAAEIVSALEFIHSLGVVYRDLKPENILLSAQGHVCLTDFGLAKELKFDKDRTNTFCGTPEYLAPEILESQGHDKAVDWWSLGTLMFEMLTGLPPFYSENVQEMYEKILSARLVFPSFMSAEAKSLLTGLLTREPEKRLGSGPSGAAEIKSHPFFRAINWDKLYRKEIRPPFVPELRDETDTRYFEREFLSLPVADTPSDTVLAATMQAAFQDFSYVNTNFHSGAGATLKLESAEGDASAASSGVVVGSGASSAQSPAPKKSGLAMMMKTQS